MARKKKRYRHFKPGGTTVKELSGVDRPAQEGALALIMKREEVEETAVKVTIDAGPAIAEIERVQDLAKRIRLTDSVDGHAHLIFDDNEEGGTTSWQKSDGAESGHDHPWMRRDDGTIVIGEAEGHGHALVAVSTKRHDGGEPPTNQPGEEDMSDKTKKQSDEAAREALEKELELAKLYGGLTDVEKQHHATLDGDAKEAFVRKSQIERRADIDKAARAGDPTEVIYTNADGEQFRKGDDPRLVAMAKRLDAQKAALKVERLTKRAESDMPNLSGDVAVKVAVLDAIDTCIKDADLHKAAIEMLKGANGMAEKAFAERGTGGAGSDPDGPVEQLEKMAEKYAVDHNVTKAVAYERVVMTPEGQELYRQTTEVR